MNKELSLRTYSAIIYVAIIFLGFSLHVLSAQLLLLFMLVVSIKEFFIVTKVGYNKASLSGITVAFCMFFVVILYFEYQVIDFDTFFTSQQVLLISILSCSAMVLWSVIVFTSKGIIKNSHSIMGVFIHILIPFYLGSFLLFYPDSFDPRIILGIFILIWINDTGAYFVGKNLGKTKLAPSISPNKTVEGLIGGAILTIITAIILSSVINFKSIEFWLIFSLIVSITSPIGDLLESKLKRISNIKDSGSIMPGHGGILDRLDGFIYSLPFLFLFVILYH